MWDQIAKGAVENYQRANGTEIDAQQMTGKNGKTSNTAVSETSEETEKGGEEQ